MWIIYILKKPFLINKNSLTFLFFSCLLFLSFFSLIFFVYCSYWLLDTVVKKKLLEIFDWLTPFFSFSLSYTYLLSFFFVSLRSHWWLYVYVLDQSFSVRRGVRFQPISLPFFDSAAALNFFFLLIRSHSNSTMKICIYCDFVEVEIEERILFIMCMCIAILDVV